MTSSVQELGGYEVHEVYVGLWVNFWEREYPNGVSCQSARFSFAMTILERAVTGGVSCLPALSAGSRPGTALEQLVQIPRSGVRVQLTLALVISRAAA